MLVDVQRDLAAGESFPLRLNFENAGAVDVEVFVEDR
jgi:copper(I)-binding protein